jgi:glycosyltransferase involved in cell wall biosynthesis
MEDEQVMKIALLVHSLDRMGGIAKHALYVARELQQLGHEVTVWAVEHNPELCYPELSGELDIRSLRRPDTESTASRGAGSVRMIGYLRSLKRYAQDQRRLVAAMPGGYDVINPHGNAIIWAAGAYKRRHRTPLVWICNDFWPMTSQRLADGAGLTERLRHLAKVLLCLPYDLLDRVSVLSVDRLVVLSERVRSQMVEHYGVDSDIVRPGIDSERFSAGDRSRARQKLGVTDGTFLLLTVCLLMPRRRLEDTVGAIRSLLDRGKDVAFAVVGRSTMYPEYTKLIESEIQRLALSDCVHLTGEVPEKDLVDYFHACDAFVWSADEGQSWGMAGMEALAAGKPLIVSRANGLAEAMQDGHTALLIEPRSPASIADATQQLIEDPELARAVAREGQELVRTRYSWRWHTEELVTRFRKALAETQTVHHSGAETLDPAPAATDRTW